MGTERMKEGLILFFYQEDHEENEKGYIAIDQTKGRNWLMSNCCTTMFPSDLWSFQIS